VRNISAAKWTDFVALQSNQSNGMAVVTNKLDLKSRAIVMHQDGTTNVPTLQAMMRQINSEGDRIEFINEVHSFGSG